MAQGLLPFQYEMEQSADDVTGRAGLPVFVEWMAASGMLRSMQDRMHVRRDSGQGWTDVEHLAALVVLNVDGGDCVEDLDHLEADPGFCRVYRKLLDRVLGRRNASRMAKRWRKPKVRTFPSQSAVFRYLEAFHDEEQERQRVPHTAFIPAPNRHTRSLMQVQQDFVRWVQERSPQPVATLDQDATLVATGKIEALFGYKGFKSYQPLTTLWAEQGLAFSEFRDGNVPAGHEQLRILKDILRQLPSGVEAVRLRSDTAAYQEDLLKYCAEGRDPRFRVIRFAIGADVTDAFKTAVRSHDVAWQRLLRKENGRLLDTGQEWAEVCYVPDWAGRSKKAADYRFIAVREPLERQGELPGITAQRDLPFPIVELDRRHYKLTAIVTNRDLPVPDLIAWYRGRCGAGEEIHAAMKHDFAGRKLPSGLFGANAAWWQIMVLAFNLSRTLLRLGLQGDWATRRMKAVRYRLIRIAGRILDHARTLVIRLTRNHPAWDTLLQARRRLLCLASGPPG